MASGDPGTRTAPAFTAAANSRVITLHMIDKSGDQWAEDWRVPVAATAAAIEAWAAAYAGTSQASMWGITDAQGRYGQAVATNANTDQRNSVKDGINLLFPNTASMTSRTMRIVAPVLAAMDGNTDTPIVLDDPVLALTAASVAAGFGTTGDYFDSAQYTQRRERKNNTRVKG